WPNTIRNISYITKDSQAIVTSIAHGFTSLDQGITTVDFLQVKGMIQINGRPGLIQQVIDADNFSVNIDSTQFFTYISGGYAIIVTGTPPFETVGAQIFNTPFQNIAT